MASFVGLNIVDYKKKNEYSKPIKLVDGIRKFCKEEANGAKTAKDQIELGDIYATEVLLYSIPMTPYDFARDTGEYHKAKGSKQYDTVPWKKSLGYSDKNVRKSSAGQLGNLHKLNLNRKLGRKVSDYTRVKSWGDYKKSLINRNYKNRESGIKKTMFKFSYKRRRLYKKHYYLSYNSLPDELKTHSKFTSVLKSKAAKDAYNQMRDHMVDTAEVYRKGRAFGIMYDAEHNGFDYPAFLYNRSDYKFQQDNGKWSKESINGRGPFWIQRAYNRYGDKIEKNVASVFAKKAVNHFNKSTKASREAIAEMNTEDFGLKDPNLKIGKLIKEENTSSSPAISRTTSMWERQRKLKILKTLKK